MYIDDGASGGNFNRKGFQDMMEDIKQGFINLVLVQDLSRFGRNYLEAGKYLEDVLPALGCRFVALADGIDTADGENDILPFLNAINDFYLKDLRAKIFAAFQAGAQAGRRLAGSAPFGYARDPADGTRLLVDEKAAKLVRQIFEMRANGAGYGRIAAALNQSGDKIWQAATIRRMLKNEAYIGHSVALGGKIRAQNTHEAIVDLATWQQVEEINKERFVTKIKGTRSLFGGLAVCAKCRKKMVFGEGSYYCRTRAQSGEVVCLRNRISGRVLENLVLKQLKEQVCEIPLDESKLTQAGRGDGVKRRKRLALELHKLENQMDEIYEGRVAGQISVSDFAAMAKDLEAERMRLAEEIGQLEVRQINIKLWDNRDLLECFVEAIEIGERIAADDEKTRNLKVYWKFSP